jgi:hypothetical protein
MKYLVLALSAIFLTSCTQTYDWQNASLSPADAERQRIIDHGYCTSVAERSVTPSRTPFGAPVQTSGTIYNRYGSSVGTFETDDGFGSGFFGGAARGFANGARNRGIIREQMARNDIYKGCMVSKGWTNVDKAKK